MRGVTRTITDFVPCAAFLLTRLMRGVTAADAISVMYQEISTHTPHARRDSRRTAKTQPHLHFYSHASCEA